MSLCGLEPPAEAGPRSEKKIAPRRLTENSLFTSTFAGRTYRKPKTRRTRKRALIPTRTAVIDIGLQISTHSTTVRKTLVAAHSTTVHKTVQAARAVHRYHEPCRLQWVAASIVESYNQMAAAVGVFNGDGKPSAWRYIGDEAP